MSKNTLAVKRVSRKDRRALRNRAWVEESDCLPGSPMCHDCAFRRGSQELADGNDLCMVVRVDIARALIDPEAIQFRPFFCHHYRGTGRDVPMDAEGNYLYDFMPNGMPRGVPVCNGWKAMVHRAKIALLEAMAPDEVPA